MVKNCFFFMIFSLLLASCIQHKSLLNFSESGLPTKSQEITNYSPIRLKENDLIQIDVKSLDSDAVAVFSNGENEGLNYLIGDDGSIDFPLVGTIYLKGMTTVEAKQEITQKLNTYFVKPPAVKVLLLNFRVNVNGEVGNPGSLLVTSGRFSIIDAITRSGDFTPYSRRDSILVIREENGLRSFGYLDFNNINILNSPYFYLRQNDVVYVQPTKGKKATVRGTESRVLPLISIGTSLIILITTLARVI